MSNEFIVQANADTFQKEVLDEDKLPVLVDFWAPWCGPCRALSPTIDALAQSYAGKLKVVKVNIDEDAQTPAKYGIVAIPTLLFFKEGEQKGMLQGAFPKAKLTEAIDAFLGA